MSIQLPRWKEACWLHPCGFAFRWCLPVAEGSSRVFAGAGGTAGQGVSMGRKGQGGAGTL